MNDSFTFCFLNQPLYLASCVQSMGAICDPLACQVAAQQDDAVPYCLG